MIYLNDFSAYTSVHYGDTSISKVYAGDNQVWPVQTPTPSYESQYLTFEATSGTCFMGFSKGSSACTLSYSIDDGSTWQAYAGAFITISSGERVLFKGDFKNGDQKVGILTASGYGRFDAYGNIMSLLYGDDFVDKISLTNQNIFDGLFYWNTNLTNAKNLILPATTLSDKCYHQMFYGCSNLTTAPVLPATTLAGHCYTNMFRNCSNLKEITCLATDISAGYCTNEWVYGVSSTGTFIKNPSMTSWPTGDNGIPANWTVVDYSS